MKDDMNMKKGVPSKPAKNSIFPVDSSKKKNPGMQTSLFNFDANKIDSTEGYGKKGKGATVDKSVSKSAENSIWPDNKCC